eukprot:TRINITY_DN1558_c3_g1_i1.p1 TRINITY_DN1558_c3_g1~~TRINITY_DN1558_c3_g1_i1.p1  ORF type:complete len:457 (-),score=85.34 TRINITY_DN1558_c3_g1_i1:135-1505(-)
MANCSEETMAAVMEAAKQGHFDGMMSVKKGAGGFLSTEPGGSQGPPGYFTSTMPVSGAMTQPVLPTAAEVQVPRRFPGHFAPHRLCNHWNAQGWCRKAETCTFAHGIQELHPDVQAQVSQSNALNPATVAKDGRVIVPGTVKGTGKGAATVASMLPADPALAFASYGAAGAAASLSTGPLMYTSPLQYSAPPVAGSLPGYGYGHRSFELNAGAVPFSMPEAEGVSPITQDVSPTDDQEASGEDGESSPSKRRPAPAPLTLDDSPQNGLSGAANFTFAKPFALSSPISALGASFATITRAAAPLASPMRISVTSRPLASPTAGAAKPLLSPTGTMYVTASSVANHVLASPTNGTAVPAPMASPARVTVMPAMRSPTSVAFPASPAGLLFSPKASPKTPVPIDRSTLLQARTVATAIDQGPPGLAQWAPTPTTKAARLGFRYPQPGLLSARPATVVER